jgi:hypothetical protein
MHALYLPCLAGSAHVCIQGAEQQGRGMEISRGWRRNRVAWAAVRDAGRLHAPAQQVMHVAWDCFHTTHPLACLCMLAGLGGS